MSYAVINDYLDLLREDINEYMRIILENRYIKNICNDFINVYIDSVYYDTYSIDKKSRHKDEMKKKLEELCNNLISSEANMEKIKSIEATYEFIDEVLLLESSYKKDTIKNSVENIHELRKLKLNKEDIDFKDILIAKIKENILNKKEFLEKYETKEFYIEKKKILNNLCQINIKHNIKFPMIYSSSAISKVFNSGIVSEDKLFIEYILTTVQVINDIESGVYNQNYILEFTNTFFEKKQKLNRLLDIINNYSTQSRISILIDYATFISYREEIYDLIKEGFKFSIMLDETFKLDDLEIKRFTLFKYVLVSRKLDLYSQILKYKNIISNIVEI